MNMKINIRYPIVFLSLLFNSLGAAESSRPNILFCLSDDQSWPHASAYGEPVIKTPVFDRVAKEGALFSHAYCAAPSCTPSRSAILTGQDIWRLGEGGQLFGTLPAKHPVYTDLLIGELAITSATCDKGWAPGNVKAGGRTTNPAGPKFRNFAEFFGKAPEGKPWCFWFGSHRSPPAIQEGEWREGWHGSGEGQGSRLPPRHTRGPQRPLRLLPRDPTLRPAGRRDAGPN